ncbi:Ig-like domain-containing protein [Sutcliffiella sp. NC1]|uniref:Ig-like domain-containing protein n=1 Tax=Sutcliffiella sp. NC1 TaxID=3004096 RepID=UPI0022DDB7A1|nr:Ig-like domain-containing protein [Sutcliffiella sp. NC1]WBL14599.1 Ig-like domain-containing protein [Sutcliffiella sp. NC1]
MKDFCEKWIVIFVITLLVFNPLFSIPLAHANTLISQTEFSETTRNFNLTNKIEVFPLPIYLKDPITNEWVPNTTGDKGGFPLYQTFISEELPSSNLSSEQQLVAGIQNEKQNITLLKFGNSLPDINGGLIYSANLNMFEIDKPVKWGYWDPTYINEDYQVLKVLSAWDGETVTWSNRPDLSSPYIDRTMRIGVDGGHFQWDVSQIVAEWYEDPTTDYGLAIVGKEEDSYRNFYTSKGYANKSYEQLDKAPRLIINYAPRPAITNAIGYGLGANSSEGYVRLSWHTSPGVKGYKLSIFNGEEYETIDVGLTNEWSSLNKNLWPSKDEVSNGEYRLKLDQSGTNLPDHPSALYENAGGTEKDPNRYYFKITAYNEFGESGASEEVSVAIPNRTAPPFVSNIHMTEYDFGKVHLKWDTSNENIKEYQVKIGSAPEKSDISTGLKTTNNEILVTSNMLLPHSTVYVSVNAVDMDGNFSGYTTPVPIELRKSKDALVTASSIPFQNSVHVDPHMSITMKNIGTEAWSAEEGFELKLVNEQEFLEVEALSPGEQIAPGESKTFQVRVKGQKPLGTITLEWQMFHHESGYFGNKLTRTITFYDDMKPVVIIASPEPLASLYKTVNIMGTATDETLQNYRLYYGIGSSPSSWNLIFSSSSKVENDSLGTWNTSNLDAGIYTLKLEAVDEAGNIDTVVREVYVNLPVNIPKVNKVTDQSTSVKGTADAGLTVFVQNGIQVIGSSTVTSAGTFSITIPKQVEGTVLEVYAKNIHDVSSDVASVMVVDGTPPSAPTVDPVADNSVQVVGRAEKGSTVIVKKGTSTLGTGITNSNGVFSVAIAKQSAGTTLQVTAKDAAGNVSAATTVTVIDKTPPPAPKVNTVGDNATSVTGTAERGATVTVKKGTTTLGSSKVNTDGTYSVTIQKQNAGTTLSVTAKDAAGNVSSVTNKTVVDKTPPPAPKVNTVGDNATTVKGTAEKGATVTVKRGTTTLGSSKVNTDGTYSVTIQKQNAGTSLSVTAKDAAGNVSSATNKTVVDKTAPPAPKVNAIYSSSTAVTGKTEANATVVVKRGSTTLGTAKASKTGDFSVKIKKQSKKVVLSVTAEDNAGNKSKATSVTVK